LRLPPIVWETNGIRGRFARRQCAVQVENYYPLHRGPEACGTASLLVTFVGPDRVWVVAHLEIDEKLRGDQVTSLVGGICSDLKHRSEYIYRVDVVPIGGAKAVP